MKNTNRGDSVLRILFFLYTAFMLWLLFFRNWEFDPSLPYKQMLQKNLHLQPLYTGHNYLRVLVRGTDAEQVRAAIINLGGNIFLFIPFGILIPRLWSWMRSYLRFLTVCAGAIFAVEVLQLFTLLGSFDIDDLILNLFGMTLGFILFTVINAPNTDKEQTA